MTAVNIRRIGDTKDLLGESPCWDERAGVVCWIDSLAGALRRLRQATGEIEMHELPAPIGSIALCASGAVIAALKNSFARYDCATRRLETLAGIGMDHPDVRLESAYVTSISRSTHLAGDLPQDGGLFELLGLPAAGVAPHRFAD